MTKRNALAAALALTAAFGLSACGGGEKAEAGHAAPAYTHVSAKSGDIARGEALAKDKKLTDGQSCIDCHGEGGAKPIDPAYPVLAGQYNDYLFHSLQAYHDGTRDHPQMTLRIQTAFKDGKLDDQGLADLAAYFAAQPGPLTDLKQAH